MVLGTKLGFALGRIHALPSEISHSPHVPFRREKKGGREGRRKSHHGPHEYQCHCCYYWQHKSWGGVGAERSRLFPLEKPCYSQSPSVPKECKGATLISVSFQLQCVCCLIWHLLLLKCKGTRHPSPISLRAGRDVRGPYRDQV